MKLPVRPVRVIQCLHHSCGNVTSLVQAGADFPVGGGLLASKRSIRPLLAKVALNTEGTCAAFAARLSLLVRLHPKWEVVSAVRGTLTAVESSETLVIP